MVLGHVFLVGAYLCASGPAGSLASSPAACSCSAPSTPPPTGCWPPRPHPLVRPEVRGQRDRHRPVGRGPHPVRRRGGLRLVLDPVGPGRAALFMAALLAVAVPVAWLVLRPAQRPSADRGSGHEPALPRRGLRGGRGPRGRRGRGLRRAAPPRTDRAPRRPRRPRPQLAQVEAVPHLVFRSTAAGPRLRQGGDVHPADPGGARAVTATACERVDQRGGTTLCLRSSPGVVLGSSVTACDRSGRRVLLHATCPAYPVARGCPPTARSLPPRPS